MVHCLIYFSTSVGLMAEEELTNILYHSRFRNAQLGITGVLLYVKGSIIQVLEGEKSAVESLYQRILNDPRHKNVVKVLSRPNPERLFTRWAMGYQTITTHQLYSLTAIIADTPEGLGNTDLNAQPILKMIKDFYDISRYN